MEIYHEIKTTFLRILPYVLLAGLSILYMDQQERLTTEQLDGLRQDVRMQTEVLSAIRDQLHTSGLVVPPFLGRSSE
jgi:hypothetical protein